jgi:hypothetical protein
MNKPKAEPKKIQKMRAYLENLREESANIDAREKELEGKLPQHLVNRDADLQDMIGELENDLQYYDMHGTL